MQNNETNYHINIKDGKQFPYDYIIHNKLIKLYEDEKKIVITKTDDVSNDLQNEVIHHFKLKSVEFVNITQKDFDDLLRQLDKSNYSNQKEDKGDIDDREDLTKLASDAPIINLVNEIIISALDKKSSDIHFEAYENFFKVRFRINGQLQEFGTYKKILYEALCARIKVMSKLDITQRRLPQDGKANLLLYDKSIDIRTSTLPTIFGESIVLRLLGVDDKLESLERLGFTTHDIDTLKRIIQKSYGAFILTGPTGSGKTTTLRCLINLLEKKTKKIITVEDPVEYTIDEINQVQTNDKIGYGFGTILRNILRQDPDVIMIGEMRDKETADIALRSAMTGHLVLSTLHTNDSLSSITRLINMGVEPYVIESSIIACAAQRLVRVLCDKCKQEYTPDKIDLNLMGKYNINAKKLNKARGCSECNNSGYSGRVGFFEVFELDENIKDMIVKRESTSNMRKYLKENNFISLFENGLNACKNGIVFIDEIKSVIGEIK